ncbi:hypothetical protein [Mycobacterium sp. 1274756.6]|uniref:hypothetical protein n=1 Tax=Mycobacterium sp. 1274756.6 TaxID=1834076 RepID=UPI0007FBBE74|nr:hypothetical protein [Mycobacterium sp. 1274756.6]OBJ71112.1 hypothetical protein A5643_08395 [Mycobacterium sp. 1274756.6]
MKWIFAAIGVALVAVAALQPWFHARTLDGTAVMSAWGHWSRDGAIDARLAPIPVGLLICAPAVWMLVAALRDRYGQAFLGAVLSAVGSMLAIALRQRVAASAPGGDAVFVSLGWAPTIVLILALAAAVVGWYLFARTELRDPPRE